LPPFPPPNRNRVKQLIHALSHLILLITPSLTLVIILLKFRTWQKWCSITFYIKQNLIGLNIVHSLRHTGCPNKHGNSVTNSISSLLCISIVLPDFKSHNIIMCARVDFMKTVNGCKDVSIMYTVIFLFF